MSTSTAKGGGMVILLLIIGLCAADASFFSNPFTKNQADVVITKVRNTAADIKNQAGDFATNIKNSAADIKNKLEKPAEACCEGCTELVSAFFHPPLSLLLLQG
jgi:hypothetical protein